jgi:membrane-bound metal-dependent hydrolase YbcI (DUF457 family)
VFIGHNAVGFASKGAAPRTSLGWLMAAPMFLDLLWPIFLILGIEHVRIAPGDTKFTPLDFYDYPWSHSLLMAIIWSVLFALAYFMRTRYAAGAVVLGFGVVSHWVCDFIVHRPDLPLYPGGPKVGLGLWNRPRTAVLLEVALFVVGVAIYVRTTRARDRAGVIGLWSFIVVLLAIYAAASQGTPPPNLATLIGMALAGFLIPPWVAWIDRHREARG